MTEAFDARIRAKGHDSYSDYLRSPEWSDFRARYKDSHLPQRCLVCGSEQFQLHHLTYARVCEEELTDVIPLCREHHVEVEEWLKSRVPRMFSHQTHLALKDLHGLNLKRLRKSWARKLRGQPGKKVRAAKAVNVLCWCRVCSLFQLIKPSRACLRCKRRGAIEICWSHSKGGPYWNGNCPWDKYRSELDLERPEGKV